MNRLLFTLLLISILISAVFGRCKLNYKKDIPSRAYDYFPLVIVESFENMRDFTKPYYFGGLIEHETCITLCSKRCWNPKAELKTKREQGVGLGQLTRVFNKNGTVKWDMLRTLKMMYPDKLKDLTWENIKKRPDLQIKALILLWKKDYSYYKGKVKNSDILWFADSAYNGGFKWLNRERRLCKFKKGCDPKKWFHNVADIKSRRAKRKLYGNRTAWDINRHHVEDVKTRMKKYKKLLMSGDECY